MRKLIFSTLSLAVAMSLNATVYATANGKEITEKELAPLLSGLGNVNIDALSANQKKELIDKGIELQLLIDEAKKSGVMDDDVYKKELEAVKDNLARANSSSTKRRSAIFTLKTKPNLLSLQRSRQVRSCLKQKPKQTS